MKKDIKDFLHLYLGVKCYDHFNEAYLKLTPKTYDGYMDNVFNGRAQIKPILRPLSDMTDKEREEIPKAKMDKWGVFTIESVAETTRYLLKQGFDIFGLHEAGLCLYKSDLK